MTKKTIEDVDRIIGLQLKRLKKKQYKMIGLRPVKWYQAKANRLEGLISALAWVKVFAIEDESYNPKEMLEIPI